MQLYDMPDARGHFGQFGGICMKNIAMIPNFWLNLPMI